MDAAQRRARNWSGNGNCNWRAHGTISAPVADLDPDCLGILGLYHELQRSLPISARSQPKNQTPDNKRIEIGARLPGTPLTTPSMRVRTRRFNILGASLLQTADRLTKPVVDRWALVRVLWTLSQRDITTHRVSKKPNGTASFRANPNCIKFLIGPRACAIASSNKTECGGEPIYPALQRNSLSGRGRSSRSSHEDSSPTPSSESSSRCRTIVASAPNSVFEFVEVLRAHSHLAAITGDWYPEEFQNHPLRTRLLAWFTTSLSLRVKYRSNRTEDAMRMISRSW